MTHRGPRLPRIVAILAGLVLVAGGLSACGGGGHKQPKVTAPPSGSKVAFLGDSYTQGTGASVLTNRWTSLVAQHFGWTELNFGVGGTGYTPATKPPVKNPYLDRVGVIAAAHPDLVIVSGGGNDLNHGFTDAQVADAIKNTYAALRKAMPSVRIVAIRPFYDADPEPAALVAYGKAVKKAVQSVGGYYLDVGTPLQGLFQDIGPDNVHPNDDGHRVLAEAVEKLFTPAA